MNVRCYFGGGFDTQNAPDRPELLYETTAKMHLIPNVDLYSTIGLNYIDLPLADELGNSYFGGGDDLFKLCYIEIEIDSGDNTDAFYQYGPTKVFYVVTGIPQILNTNCARVPIQEDVLLTHGIKYSDLKSGRVGICHLTQSEDAKLTLSSMNDDRFRPAGILTSSVEEITSDKIKGDTTDSDKFNFINCTIDPLGTVLTDLADYKYYVNPLKQVDAGVTIPMVKPRAFTTDYKLNRITDNNGSASSIQVTYTPKWYSTYQLGYNEGDTSDEHTLDIIRAYGLQDTIVDSWEVPACYVGNRSFVLGVGSKDFRNDGSDSGKVKLSEVKILSLTPKSTLLVRGLWNFGTTRNMRCHLDENSALIIVNKASGNYRQYQPQDLTAPDASIQPQFYITADLRSNGCPTLYPMYLSGKVNVSMNGVNGMTWGKSTLVSFVQYGAQSQMNQLNLAKREMQLQQSKWVVKQTVEGAFVAGDLVGSYVGGVANTAMGLVAGGPAGAAVGFASSVDDILGSAKNAINYGIDTAYGAREMSNQRMLNDYAKAQLQPNTKAPNIEFTYNEGMREVFGNYFTFIKLSYTQDQLQQLDRFYDRWGYRMGGMDISQLPHIFDSRQNFNYVSLTNVQLDKNISLYERQILANQLASITLWHVNPSSWKPTDGNPFNTNV